MMDKLLQFLRDNWLALLVLGGLAAAWLVFRTPSSDLASLEEFDRRVRGGRPVIAELYANT